MTHYTDEFMQIPDIIDFFISIEFHPEGCDSPLQFSNRLYFTLDKPNEGEKLNLFSELINAGDVDVICTKHVKATGLVMREVVSLYLLAFDGAEKDKKSLLKKLLCLTVGSKLLEFIMNLVKLELITLSRALFEWIAYLSKRSVALIERIEDNLKGLSKL